MTTSRHRILDAVEAIKNCEAIVSHCNEIMDSIEDNAFKEEAESGNKLEQKYNNLFKIKDMAIKARRNIMLQIEDNVENIDHDYWCIIKHAIAAKGFMDEVNDATGHVMYKESQMLYKTMSMALSQFIGEDMEVCARCLLDKYLANETDNQKLAENI